MMIQLTTQPFSSTSWIGARWPSWATQFRTCVDNVASPSWIGDMMVVLWWYWFTLTIMSNLFSSSLTPSTMVIVCPIFTIPLTSLAYGPFPTWSFTCESHTLRLAKTNRELVPWLVIVDTCICIQHRRLSPRKFAVTGSSISTWSGGFRGGSPLQWNWLMTANAANDF